MAKIHEEIIIIKLSKLVKDGDTAQEVSGELISTLEAVVQEMVGDSIVVEVIKE